MDGQLSVINIYGRIYTFDNREQANVFSAMFDGYVLTTWDEKIIVII